MKNKKSLVALVVMAFMLVASITMAATGAWFTDKDESAVKELSFGTLNITSVTENVAVHNEVDTGLTELMPGSTLSGKLTITYTGTAKAYIRYKVTKVGAGAEYVIFTLAGASEDGWVYTTSDAVATPIDISASVANTVDNNAQGKPVTIKFEVEALQQANTTGGNTADGAWNGVTIQEQA